jgi:hypothetical protein
MYDDSSPGHSGERERAEEGGEDGRRQRGILILYLVSEWSPFEYILRIGSTNHSTKPSHAQI